MRDEQHAGTEFSPFYYYRARHGMSQQEGAELFGVDRITIYRWERWISKPGKEALKLMAQKCRMAVRELAALFNERRAQ